MLHSIDSSTTNSGTFSATGGTGATGSAGAGGEVSIDGPLIGG